MHRDKVEELKKVLQSKKEAEEKVQNIPSVGTLQILEGEVEKLKKSNEELEKKLEQAKTESKESNDKYIRLYAEFENYRKRALKEKQEIIHFTQEQVLKEFLQVLDDLERAITHAEKSEDLKVLLEGVKLIEKNFLALFEKFGLTLVETVGRPFNPHFHEAMAHKESIDHPPDTVSEEFRKGYLLKGKLIRPALVTVSKSLENEEQKRRAKSQETEENS